MLDKYGTYPSVDKYMTSCVCVCVCVCVCACTEVCVWGELERKHRWFHSHALKMC